MIRPFGEAAFLVEVGAAERAQALVRALRHDWVDGMTGIVAGRDSVLVEMDPMRADVGAVAGLVESLVPRLDPTRAEGRTRSVPVVYGGRFGPDLDDVAGTAGLPAADVIELHSGVALRVLFAGFAPGFAYLGDLPSAIHVPRLTTPRTSTPGGSVGIAGSMSGVYPADLPGGWRIIGRTPITLFDARRDPPAYLAPGDVVRFRPIEPSEWDDVPALAEDW